MSQMPPVQTGYQGPVPGAPKPAGMAIAAMVVGIISVVLFCFIYVSIPCAIVAIILGFIARNNAKRGTGGGGGMALAGLICGICSIALIILFWVGFLAFLGIGGKKLNDIQQEFERQQKLQQQGHTMLPGAFEHFSALCNIFGYFIGR
jgi:hypothetical protein